MSQLGDYADMAEELEEILVRRGDGQGLSMDADFILKSFGMMKCMDFIFDMVDPKVNDSIDKEFCKKYPLYSKYLNDLNPFNN